VLELESLSEVGEQLRSSLQEALDSIPNVPQRPQELARKLKLNGNLTSRLCAALRSHDPLAAMSLVPGPVPLRRLLRAASATGADQACVKRAHQAIEQFESVIREEFDDRAGLDGLLGMKVPEMRRRHELTAKQAVFRGMEAIKGISSDAASVTYLVHPSAGSAEHVDLVMVGGYFGLRRLRPGVAIQFTAELGKTGSGAPANGAGDAGSEPVRESLPGDMKDAPLIREFCRPSDMTVTRENFGDLACYEVASSAIGRSSAIDVTLAEWYPRRMTRLSRPANGRIRHFDATIEQPCKLFVFDLLLHKDVWPGAAFDLSIYDTTIKGTVDPNNERRKKDEFALAETLQPVGDGIDALRSSKLPRYVELHARVMERMGWQAQDFRAMRCQVAYPVYGSQVCLRYRNTER
jgi:hypothetical protein